MCGRYAEVVRGARQRQVGTILHQSTPHPLNTRMRMWAIWFPGTGTVRLQEDKFIVRIK